MDSDLALHPTKPKSIFRVLFPVPVPSALAEGNHLPLSTASNEVGECTWLHLSLHTRAINITPASIRRTSAPNFKRSLASGCSHARPPHPSPKPARWSAARTSGRRAGANSVTRC